MKADGSTAGGACNTQSQCTPPLSCDTNSGLCVAFSTKGNYGDPCYQNTDCNQDGKYPGLLCTQTDGKTQGKCDCTPDSGILKLCKDDFVCASGASPGPSPPGPSPSPSSWPAAFAPPPPDDFIKNKFTGSCATSSWYKANGDPLCVNGNLGLLDNNSKALCMPSATYTKQGAAFSGSYSKACYIDQ